MKKAFAYICAPEDAGDRQLQCYSRSVMELGYIPNCPYLEYGSYLTVEIPDEQEKIRNMSEERLRRCRMLVVCGGEVDGKMAAEIALANRLGIICTTLDGLKKCKGSRVKNIKYN